jgi:cell division septum initiation protein DivIVA
LEAQHHDAQDTIKELENKVASLGHMLQSAEEALANAQALPKKVDEVEPTPDVVEARESMAVLEG